MINKRVKLGIQKIKKPTKQIKFGLGTLALMMSCLLLLVIATFTQIKINFELPDGGVFSNLRFEYIPQIPIVMFIAALLGKKWGSFTVFLYVILGLTPDFPIFGLGGGPTYIFQYSFGYIFAYIFGAYYCAKELRKEGTIHTFLAAFIGVFIIHIVGMIYMTVIALLRHDSLSFIFDLIYFQSLSKVLYDIVCSLIAIIAAKCSKKLLWILLN